MNEYLNKSKIIECVYLIRNYLFPKHFFVKQKLSKCIKNSLYKQVKLAYKIKHIKNPWQKNFSNEFIKRIHKLKEIIESDLKAFLIGDPAAEDENEIILVYSTFLAILFYRIAHVIYEMKIPYLPRIITEHVHQKTGIDIHPGATIGKYFFIDHGTGVVIGQTTIIKDHVRIYQGVTLGAISLNKGHKLKGVSRHPKIGNNVIIYANAAILGGDTYIGDNVIIGANTMVLKSIPSNTIVSAADSKNKLTYKSI